MSITFHCDFCNKKIEANENAAGKWGRCPSCHNKIYVPNLNVEDDLKLAPVDEEAEKRKKKLMDETFSLEQTILSERSTPAETNNNETPPEPATAARVENVVDEDALYETVVKYLRQMADGDLDEADSTLISIQSAPEESLKLLDRIALADIPEAELSDIAPHVLAGLIRTLRSQID
jgi:hypothetical protein